MKYRLFIPLSAFVCMALLLIDGATGEEVAPVRSKLEKEYESATKGSSSGAGQRLALKRLLRDVKKAIEHIGDKPEHWALLELLFRVQKQLIKLDDSEKHREAMLETCRELVKAPNEQAHLAFEADLLLSQVELAKQGVGGVARTAALRPFVNRYVETEKGAEALRMAMVMALESGDAGLVDDLREMMAIHFPADPEMINFQRDRLAGQVIGAPFAGAFKRSDGKTLRFPMQAFGRPAIVFFWSNDEQGLAHLKDLAEATQNLDNAMAGRIEVIGFNLDDLPDAGESIVRSLGVDWQCMYLPGGRKHPAYQAYARRDPLALQISPTGQAALVVKNGDRTGRFQNVENDAPNYGSILSAAAEREWMQPEYCAQLTSLSAGDFLVFDPEGDLDPLHPPELKADAGVKVQPLERSAECVPTEVLQAIQDCFPAPPMRYQIPRIEILAAYTKAVKLCRETMAEHSDAPDLWMVRNRLIVFLMGLWKVSGDVKYLEAATQEAKTAVEAGFPEDGDVVARFCLAREALCRANATPREIIDQFVVDSGGDQASGLEWAAASILALDAADRIRYVKIRETILERHSDNPMLGVFSAFLIDRANQYWLFQMPFNAGYAYDSRATYFQHLDHPEDARRLLKAELRTADGRAFRIPEDLTADYTAIFFSVPEPWSSKFGDDLYSPTSTALSFAAFAESRPLKDSQAVFVILGEEPHVGKLSDHRRYTNTPCTMLALPGGLENPLVSRMGMLATNRSVNSVLVNKEGRILAMISGLTKRADRGGYILTHVVARLDMLKTLDLLDQGQIEAAKDFIFTLAPPHDPDALDALGRPAKKPRHRTSHLRARARVYMALGEWEKALADAEEVYAKQLAIDEGMSLRTGQLSSDEALRNEIAEKAGAK